MAPPVRTLDLIVRASGATLESTLRDEHLQGILEAIARARVAARRMVLAESLADDTGVQIGFQAVLHNLFVIGEAVKTIPPETLELVPDFAWSEAAEMAQVIAPTYHHIVPADVRRSVDAAIDPLEQAVRRLISRR